MEWEHATNLDGFWMVWLVLGKWWFKKQKIKKNWKISALEAILKIYLWNSSDALMQDLEVQLACVFSHPKAIRWMSFRSKSLKGQRFRYGSGLVWAEKRNYKTLVPSMIHSARPVFTPVEITILAWPLFCFARFRKGATDGRTDNPCENSDHYWPWLWVGLVDQ